ncbi:MAG: hypothetical protein ABIQ75_09575, partial [Flavobacteriales bacterium]
MNRIFFGLAALLLSAPLVAQQYADVRVGLFQDAPTASVMVMGDKGPLTIWADGKQVGELSSSDGLMIRSGENGIHAKSLVLDLTAKKSL